MPPRPQPGMQPTATTTAVYRKPARWHSAPRPHKTMRHLPRVAPSKIQCTNPNASQAAARHANHGHHNCRVTSPLTALPASQNNETPTTCSAVQHAPNKSSADRHVRWLETSTKCSNIYTVHQLCLTGRSQADNSRHSKVNSWQSGSASRTGAGHHVRHPVYISGLRPRGRQRRQEPCPTRQKGIYLALRP